MKRNYLLSALAALFLIGIAACSTVKGLTNADKKGFTGNWTLTSITFDGMPANTKFKATVFDDVPYSCLTNSSWNLPGNGNGSYTVNATDAECGAGTRTIVWSIQNDNGIQYFQFKRVDGGVKAKTVTSGYRMQVSSVTDNSMILRSPVDFEGKNVYIVYNFTK
jgi:hypothetical protein